MKILLTGGNGFVGINILNEIIKNTNLEVVCLINKNDNNIPKNVTRIYNLDTDINFDIIIHAGGNPDAKLCIESPKSALNDNIIQTFNILEFSRNNNCKKIIFISGCEVYGCATSNSNETDVLISKNMYGASKVACEHMFSAYFHSYGISSVMIRLLNTYGAYCQPKRFPSIIVKKFETEENPHFILTSKNTKRWLSITEMSKRIIFIINNMENGFNIFNFVGDEDLTLVEFIKKLSNNKPFTYEYKNTDLSGYNPDYNANGEKFLEFEKKINNRII